LYLLIFIFIASVGAKQTLNNMQTNCWKQDNSPPRQPLLCGADTLLAVQQDVVLPVLFRAMSEY
jgi:hypothetical protein